MIVSNIPQTIYYPEPQVQAKPQNFYVTQQPYSGSVVQHVVQQQQPTYIYQTLSQPKVVPLTKETLKQHEVMHQRTKWWFCIKYLLLNEFDSQMYGSINLIQK